MVENLTKMMVVMVRPSLHEAIEKRAAELRMRVSAYIRQLVEEDLRKKGAK